ncbi:RND transporter [Pseudoalteromonas sp. BMB]|uniref:efflux RND transporter periplasmic adaptor subunit n=1 Tax=Pseudoalteromonas sp. BMB TaxID=1874619 RepID=UPI00083DC0E6|nr:HlyD family efflux transporter periplasmic adaptor subunit [Pseudoalteromonas sp. BMB]ODB35865.1 RND transporter [Pseudoalteromonas sp. BMB]
MDVKKNKKTRKVKLNTKQAFIIALSVVTLAGIFTVMKDKTISMPQEDLLIERVKAGELEVTVDGYGILVSGKQQLITANSDATVEEIVLKPGAKVNADSVIAKLSNPELEELAESAQQDLLQAIANMQQLSLNNEREKLIESSQLIEVESQLEGVKLQRESEEQLVEEGIVSRLSYKQTLLEEKQLEQRVSVLKERAKQLTKIHEKSINIEKGRVKQSEGVLNNALARLEKLEVKAGFEGVLQSLSVELGQSLRRGDEIALIGSVTELISEIQVPQNQAQLIEVGQPVILKMRDENIVGEVSRVDPVVNDGTVLVEVALPAQLPSSARPLRNIEGTVIVKTIPNAKYIRKPVGAKPNSSSYLYRYDGDSGSAERFLVQFGESAGKDIQLLSGANTGEFFIISDLSSLQEGTSRISIH